MDKNYRFEGSFEEHYNNVSKARDNGFEIIWGSDTTLLLDLDTQEQVNRYTLVKKWIFKALNAGERETWTSKSGNTHVIIELSEPLSVEIRIALQMVLGSDLNRGAMEILQVIRGANPIALFKPDLKIKNLSQNNVKDFVP